MARFVVTLFRNPLPAHQPENGFLAAPPVFRQGHHPGRKTRHDCDQEDNSHIDIVSSTAARLIAGTVSATMINTVVTRKAAYQREPCAAVQNSTTQVLMLLGAVPTGRSPSVDAERYVDLDDHEHFQVSLERSNDEWSIVDMDAVEA